MKHVIIGNSAGAVGAIEGIRIRDRKSSITVISAENMHTYARPLISYLLAGKVEKNRLDYRPQDFYEKNNVLLHLGQRAKSIDTESNEVLLESGETIRYDRLLVATGSKPVNPDLPGTKKANVFSFYTISDIEQIQKYTGKGKKAVVLGAGLTALKAAEALVALGMETTLIVRSRILRNFLDEGAGNLLSAHLQQCGIHMVIGSEPAEVLGEPGSTCLRLKNGKEFPFDLLISAVGIAPDTDVVQGSPVALDQGILTDEGMRTNIPAVFAAGDVAQGYDLLTGRRRVIPLLPVAYAQGETAGRNMSGDNANYSGMGMNAVSFFSLPVISAGRVTPEINDEVHLQTDQANQYYRKLILRDNCLCGFVLVNKIDRAGMLTRLIREKVDVSKFKDSLLNGSYNNAYLPEEMRRAMLSATG
jgi:NAD(P)H-nitrite reductase large subunit